MNILLVNVPSRTGSSGFVLPLGLLYVGGIIERCGHTPKITDLYLNDIEQTKFNIECLDEIINDFKPSIIGFGGIATSYGKTKQLSIRIKNKYPNIIQIAGGALASVYELLLSKTEIDIVIHGEAEISLPKLLQKIEKKQSYHNLSGISYLSTENTVTKNIMEQQIRNIDLIPYPAYHLVDIIRYLGFINEWRKHYKIREEKHKDKGFKTYIPIISSRGCTHACSFCYRHVKGLRQHSVKYIINHIKYLKETYRINGFQFFDELFNSNINWMYKFCDEIEAANLNIFYFINGARINNDINKKILLRLKNTGCLQIEYGQEHGSDTILKEYGKGVTVQQNFEITKLTREIGLFNIVQLVIGSPGETTATIKELIKFLKKLGVEKYSLNYLIPLPETPIWKYVKDRGLIRDTEGYLNLVAKHGGVPIINLTSSPDRIWHNWGLLIKNALKLHYYLKNRQYPKYFIYKILTIITPLIPIKVKKIIKRMCPVTAWMG